MFIVTLTYKRPLEEVDRYLEAHRAHLDSYYRSGLLLLSGRKIPRDGGVILVRGHDREAVERLIQADPFHANGIADYGVTELEPTRWDELAFRSNPSGA